MQCSKHNEIMVGTCSHKQGMTGTQDIVMYSGHVNAVTCSHSVYYSHFS